LCSLFWYALKAMGTHSIKNQVFSCIRYLIFKKGCVFHESMLIELQLKPNNRKLKAEFFTFFKFPR
jgi:hypothetical protein